MTLTEIINKLDIVTARKMLIAITNEFPVVAECLAKIFKAHFTEAENGN
ncbi:MAG: hypothetical protein ACM3MI_03775 [Clostridiales bacterium]